VVLLAAAVSFAIPIRHVKVEGGEIYSKQEIISSAMSDRFSYRMLYFFVKSQLGALITLPFTQEIDVEWNSPTSVTLHVYDKTISGCVKYMGKYIYFDKDGVVLQSLTDTMDGVPIVTGIKFGKFALGEAFDVDDDTLFDTIMNLSSLIAHYNVPVNQIKFDDKAVTIYSGKVQVYLGEKDFYDDDMAVLASVLKKTNKKGLSGTINMEHFVPGNRISLQTNETVDGSTDTDSAEEDGQDLEESTSSPEDDTGTEE
jgi:cell division protein FtsQ